MTENLKVAIALTYREPEAGYKSYDIVKEDDSGVFVDTYNAKEGKGYTVNTWFIKDCVYYEKMEDFGGVGKSHWRLDNNTPVKTEWAEIPIPKCEN